MSRFRPKRPVVLFNLRIPAGVPRFFSRRIHRPAILLLCAFLSLAACGYKPAGVDVSGSGDAVSHDATNGDAVNRDADSGDDFTGSGNAGMTQQRYPGTQSHSAHSWAYSFFKWNNGQTYVISDDDVPEEHVGKEVGRIKRNVGNFDAVNVQDGEPVPDTTLRDGDSNMLAEGTGIFEFAGAGGDGCLVVGGHWVKACPAERPAQTEERMENGRN